MLYIRGQSEILSAVILIGITLIMGIGLVSIAVPTILRISEENNRRTLLINEQSNLVIYKEYETPTHVYIGILRVEPSSTPYALAILSKDLRADVIWITGVNDLIQFPTAQNNPVSRIVFSKNIFYFYNGEYYELPTYEYINVVYIPQDIVENYVSKAKPFIISINKDTLRSLGIGEARVMLLIQVSDKFYEVGEWIVTT
ncbi:MAG: hypothetical protein QXZ41_07980 [Ignisphaera sp.]